MSVLPRWWNRRFLGWEFAACLVATVALLVWSECFGGRSTLEEWLRDSRGPLYSALSTIFASLLGFTIATVAIVLSFATSPRLEIVRTSRHYATLWRVFKSAIRWLAFATIFALVALAIDSGPIPSLWVLYPLAGISLIVLSRIARCIWVLENVIDLVARPSSAK